MHSILKSYFFLATITAFLVSGAVGTTIVQAEDTDSLIPDMEVRVDYVSKYIWRGIDLFANDDPGINPQIFVDLYGTGFYAGVWAMIPPDDEQRGFQEFDWYGGYYGTVNEKETLQLDYDLGYVYYDFPLTGKAIDFQEIILKLTLPNALQLGEVTVAPYTTTVYTWPVTSKGFQDGWWIGAGLQADYTLPESSSITSGQSISLKTETYFTDNGAQFGIDTGFTHLETGLSTTLAWDAISITPGVHYSWTWEDTTNDENEFWVTVALAYAL